MVKFNLPVDIQKCFCHSIMEFQKILDFEHQIVTNCLLVPGNDPSSSMLVLVYEMNHLQDHKKCPKNIECLLKNKM